MVALRMASLRMVAPGAGFRVGTLYRPKNSLKTKKKRSSVQNELVFSPKVCDDQKRGLCLPISGFSVSKKQMVSPQNGDNRGGPPPPTLH